MDTYFHFSSVYLEVGLFNHMVTLCLTIWQTASLLSKAAVPFFIPTGSTEGFQFLYTLVSSWFINTCLLHCNILSPILNLKQTFWIFGSGNWTSSLARGAHLQKAKGWTHIYQWPSRKEKANVRTSSPFWVKTQRRTSLVVQWLNVCLPMQGSQVRSLVQEDSTCLGATRPMCHNYWAHTLELARAGDKRSHCSEKPGHRH